MTMFSLVALITLTALARGFVTKTHNAVCTRWFAVSYTHNVTRNMLLKIELQLRFTAYVDTYVRMTNTAVHLEC